MIKSLILVTSLILANSQFCMAEEMISTPDEGMITNQAMSDDSSMMMKHKESHPKVEHHNRRDNMSRDSGIVNIQPEDQKLEDYQPELD